MNGYATPFPTNRIVVYAHPPSDEESLRNYSDWNELVVTHELTHIFHLDRTRGIWRLGQYLLGRNPLLFPNVYGPSWVTEGLAVYYESRLTGAGRLESGEHFMVARAAAMAKEVPRLSELARGSSRYPGGEVVYVYGSLMFDYLSRTTSPAKVRDFVEREAADPIPFSINRPAKRAFGISFETAWKRWRDSLYAHASGDSLPPGWRDLTVTGRSAFFPRWVSDSLLWYAGAKGKEVPALYSVDLNGREKNLGRRNSLSANLRRSDGSIVYADEELVTPYVEGTDLWVQSNGVERQLTRGMRLHSPDVSRSGSIVAIQNTPASTRLVRVSPDGATISVLSEGTLDIQWSDPRWSPDGTRIAVVRLSRGESAILVFDSAGRELQTLIRSSAITASPSWSPDGRHLVFSSERSGSSQLYEASVERAGGDVRRLTQVATGIFDPEPSPDGKSVAATLYRADGYHIGVMPLPAFESLPVSDSGRVSPRFNCIDCVAPLIGRGADSTSAFVNETGYSALGSLLPRYWIPVFESSLIDGSAFGGETSGTDVIGRHAYDLTVLHNSTFGDNSAWLYYKYAGLGMPLIIGSATQDYSRDNVIQRTTLAKAGTISERSRTLSLQAVLVHPRIRVYSAVAIGAELEQKEYSTTPDTLLGHLSSFFQRGASYPTLFLSGDFATARHPALSISAEDGIDLNGVVRQRWSSASSGGTSASAVVAVGAFKSLDLPGFAHHVLALRAAGGVEGAGSSGRFSAGGLSGSSLPVFSTASGGERRTFGVRGYPVGSEEGTRAVTATAEYRAPIAAPSRGFRFFPLFVDKISADLFGEAGRAYCPAAAANGTGICQATDLGRPWMSSVGVELNLDTGIRLDIPARLRFGAAFPLAHRTELGAPRASAYATFGSSF